MFKHSKISQLNDFFTELHKRPGRGVYFYRISGYNQQILAFLKEYYQKARENGTVIEGRIPNPDNNNLSYYNEMVGPEFRLDANFLSAKLRRWMPRLAPYKVTAVTEALMDTLNDLRRQGKNDNMLKNAYIKFMCWMYYRFDRVLLNIGEDKLPKILYDGEVGTYELLMFRILNTAGCDIVFLEYAGDDEYLKSDPQSQVSCLLEMDGQTNFPQGFSIAFLRRALEDDKAREGMYGRRAPFTNCTNAWIRGRGFDDPRTAPDQRGNDAGFFYNCFIRMNGVQDKINYANDLYKLQFDIRGSGRRMVIIDNGLPQPTPEELSAVRLGSYNRTDRMIMDLVSNIGFADRLDLRSVMVKAFVDLMFELTAQPDMNLTRLKNRGVILLCWLKRYGEELFKNWVFPQVACLALLGGCKNDNEASFLRLLARMPVDVLIFVPDKSSPCCLSGDKWLYEQTFDDSLKLDKYPQDASELRVGTVAYHAERELDQLLYQDSGMFRLRQHDKAQVIVLKTMYEEISILWGQELRFRPNFAANGDTVMMPVLFAKISGVKDGNVDDYWSTIKTMITPDTLVFKKLPCIRPGVTNPFRSLAPSFLKNGLLMKDEIKACREYRYSMLREEAQEHILCNLQRLIDERIIKGTYENGTEYNIIATVLNMDKTIIRMIQKFDFTKSNPKVIIFSMDEDCMSLEDTILFSFLSLVGFDVAFFVPTGYRTIEGFYNRPDVTVVEHQAGEYMYDLTVPDFKKIKGKSAEKKSWREIFFRKG